LVGKITALVYFQLACLPLRYASRSVRVERIRIRSAQLRGFASLNFLSELRLGQTACAYTFAILPTQKNKKQPAKNAGAPRCYAPTGVFCFLLRHSGCGFGSGGSPVPRVCAVAWCGVSGFLWRSFRLRGLVKWLLWLVFAVRVFSAVVSASRGVAVGCASGADRFALLAARGLGAPVSLFSASSFGVGRGSFARRSAALVSAVAASGSGCGLVAFVSSACPACLFPSALASRCFGGFGSGSWSSVALAIGLGVPVVVFPCAGSGVSASSLLPVSWSGSWVSAGVGCWSAGFRFVPSSSPSLPF
jgi:hypothetical protein